MSAIDPPSVGDNEANAMRNLARFISGAKRSPALAGIVWDNVEWKFAETDAVAQKVRAHRRHSNTIVFSVRESSGRGSSRVSASNRVPMSAPYVDFAKADVRSYAEGHNVSINVLRRLLTAHQFLERQLRSDGPVLRVTNLALRHFRAAESALNSELASATAYRVSQDLAHISRVVDERRLTPRRVGYETELKRPLDGDELTEEGQAAGLKKMISPKALDKLADIFANPADDNERLIISIVGLFVAGGFRAGEVLTVPVDCWIVEDGRGDSVDPQSGTIRGNRGILYAAEKAQDYRIKWLPNDAVEMAERAVNDLTRLCRPAREMAAWMESNPGRLRPLADLDPCEFVSGHEACERLGFALQTHVNWKIPREIRSIGWGRTAWYRVEDIERMFLPSPMSMPVHSMPSGRVQKLSETLVVIWRNQFHGNRPPLRFLPVLMTHAMLSGEISSPPSHLADGHSSLLSRYGLRVTTKQFRHWLNTLADLGGVSDIDLAKWMGRRDITQNRAYKHKLLAVRTAEARRLIVSGEAVGVIPRIAQQLALADRTRFVEAAVEAAHVMPFGMCVHNFAQSPCPNCDQCLRKCPQYIRIKGDVEQRQALLEMREHQLLMLRKAEEAKDFYGADRWLARAKETIEGIDEALAADNDDSIPTGAEIRAFKSNADPKALTS